MTDLRDQLPAFEAAAARLLTTTPPTKTRATCHPDRPVEARGLCDSCYQTAWRHGQLDQHPTSRTQRRLTHFIADYELLRSEGYTRTQIAHRLGMTRNAVDQAYYRVIRAGDLTPDRRTTA